MANSRRRGIRYELDKRLELINVGYDDVVTTRSESRALDARGVDLFGQSMPFYVQCKLTNGKPFNHKKWFSDYVERLPNDKPVVVFNRITFKSDKGRFINDGEFAIMKLTDFYELIRRLNDGRESG